MCVYLWLILGFTVTEVAICLCVYVWQTLGTTITEMAMCACVADPWDYGN